MGNFKVREIKSNADRNKFYHAVIADIAKFEKLIANGQLETAQNMIGAEQEICIIDQDFRPSPRGVEILSLIKDDHYTSELALFNLEFNSDPMILDSNTFKRMEDHLKSLYKKGQKVANKFYSNLFITGILPTLKYRHLHFSLMTPEPRYQILSKEMLRLRGDHFSIHLEGVDELYSNLDSVLFEACNTSFQMHLQVNPHTFQQTYNWAQMISGPVLAAGTNSPLLFDKELWHENRIALFKQSMDTRTHKNQIRKLLSRVYFGSEWLQGGAPELWKNLVARFPGVLMGEEKGPRLEKDAIPHLNSVRLLNGTTYTWNRLCYGVHNNKAHIRIECRYLPAGPTIVDEVANLAFWIGLMHGMPEEYKDFEKNVPFQTAKDNFIRAARTGIHSNFNWFGENVSASALICNDLIPLAAEGLKSQGVSVDNINYYLGIIHDRAASGQSGSEWSIRNYRGLCKKYKPSVCSRMLVKASLLNQNENTPVHLWEDIIDSEQPRNKGNFVEPHIVEDIMSSDVHTVTEKDTVELAIKIMDWKGFHHLIVEDDQKKVTGMLSSSQFENFKMSQASTTSVGKVMTPNVITIKSSVSINEAKATMSLHGFHCLPVIDNGIIVGIITDKDIYAKDGQLGFNKSELTDQY